MCLDFKVESCFKGCSKPNALEYNFIFLAHNVPSYRSGKKCMIVSMTVESLASFYQVRSTEYLGQPLITGSLRSDRAVAPEA